MLMYRLTKSIAVRAMVLMPYLIAKVVVAPFAARTCPGPG
jgi:hypothetical protein